MIVLNPQLLAHIENHEEEEEEEEENDDKGFNDSSNDDGNKSRQNYNQSTLEFNNANILDPPPPTPASCSKRGTEKNTNDAAAGNCSACPTEENRRNNVFHQSLPLLPENAFSIAMACLAGYIAGSSSCSNDGSSSLLKRNPVMSSAAAVIIVIGLIIFKPSSASKQSCSSMSETIANNDGQIIHKEKEVGKNDSDNVISSATNGAIGTAGTPKSTIESLNKEKEEEIEKLVSLQQQCRLRASAALGSIHAPPLTALTTSTNQRHLYPPAYHVFNYKEEQEEIKSVASFSETHANLLSILDQSIQIIKMGGGLYLGLGPNSHSVSRVENAMEGRRQQHCGAKGKSLGAPSPLFGLRHAREILFQIMCDEASSLDSLFVQMIKIIDSKNEEEENELHRGWQKDRQELQNNSEETQSLSEEESSSSLYDDDDDYDDTCTMAQKIMQQMSRETVFDMLSSASDLQEQQQLITLSLLITARKELGEKLSHVLSCAFSLIEDDENYNSTTTIQHPTTRTSELYDSIQKSIHAAEERTQFLLASFPTIRRYSNSILSQKELTPSPFKKEHSNVKTNNGDIMFEKEYQQQQQQNKKWSSQPPPRLFNNYIHHIRTRIDAAHLSLWAFEQLLMEKDSKDAAANVDGNVMNQHEQEQINLVLQSLKKKKNDSFSHNNNGRKDEDGMEWWSILRDMLEEAMSSYCDMNEHIIAICSSSSDNKTEKDDVMITPAVNDAGNTNALESTQYEFDNGKTNTTDDNYKDEESQLWKNKTLVFSGKGNLIKKAKSSSSSSASSSSKQSNSSTIQAVAPPPSPFQQPSNRMTLLRELQNRIDKMELAEEWDAVVAQDDDDDDDGGGEKEEGEDSDNSKDLMKKTSSSLLLKDEKRYKEQDKETSAPITNVANNNRASKSLVSTPFFLGATGDLLSELKGAMTNTTAAAAATATTDIVEAEAEEEFS